MKVPLSLFYRAPICDYGKEARIKYLELDEFTYIENDKVKIRQSRQLKEERCTWDEMWDIVLSHIKKIAEYEEKQMNLDSKHKNNKL